MAISRVVVTIPRSFGSNSEDIYVVAYIGFDYLGLRVDNVKLVSIHGKRHYAFPSKDPFVRCRDCGRKSHASSFYCSNCGVEINDSWRPAKDDKNRDVAYPINHDWRLYFVNTFDYVVGLARKADLPFVDSCSDRRYQWFSDKKEIVERLV